VTRGRVAARREPIAPLLYWLLVVGGLLAAHRVLEHDDPSRAAGLWMGAIVGTAVGQFAAARRFPLWAVVLFVPLLTMMAIDLGLVLALVAGLALHGPNPADLEVGVMAYIPAVLCGYASLSERGGGVAFWFPTSLWALGIVDGAEGAALPRTGSVALLGVLAGLFVAFLWAREARRVGLWQMRATVPLSVARPAVVLRRSPARGLAQAAFVAATAAATLGITLWIAPHLWQDEPADGRALARSAAGAGGAGGAPCCPKATDNSSDSRRLREYFPLLHAHDEEGRATRTCVACGEAAPRDAVVSAGNVGTAPAGYRTPERGFSSSAGSPPDDSFATGGGATPISSAAAATPYTPPMTPPAAPAASANAPQLERPAPASDRAAVALATEPIPTTPPPITASTESFGLPGWPWLLALVAAALGLPVLLRPLRRTVTLRHLRAPLWTESLDQRVSNLWQLVLVGLRDAGWHATSGEQPRELAGRVAVPGVETCADVLERVRHGVRVEPADLDAMREAAQRAYATARRRTGPLGRALSWLRWPLV
jgi:hypothetical protein